MILTLIFAMVAGWAARPIEPQVTEALFRVFGEETMPDAPGRRVASFALALAGAVVVLFLLGIDPPPFALLIGGLIGYFQQEIRDAILNRQA